MYVGHGGGSVGLAVDVGHGVRVRVGRSGGSVGLADGDGAIVGVASPRTVAVGVGAVGEGAVGARVGVVVGGADGVRDGVADAAAVGVPDVGDAPGDAPPVGLGVRVALGPLVDVAPAAVADGVGVSIVMTIRRPVIPRARWSATEQ